MSDYSFMQSGLSGDYNPMAGFSQHDLLILLGVFTRNAMEVAGRHAKLCGRNGVTKNDLQTALKYEVFDFVGNPDTFAELMRIKTEMASGEGEECENEADQPTIIHHSELDLSPCTDDEDEDDDEEGEAEEEPSFAQELTDALVGDKVVPDDEIQEYSEIDPESANIEDREFLRNYYNYKKKWDTWEPTDGIETSLYNAINAIM